MNYGPLIFLAAFFALSGSWVGFVLTPQMQVGQLQQTNVVVSGVAYPLARPGLAREGLEVYRANGCAYCHSQEIVQTGTMRNVVLNEAGTNQAAAVAALMEVTPGTSEGQAREVLRALPKTILQGVTKEAADAVTKSLSTAGAKAEPWVVPVGPDITRGWGKRRTVAQDFLFDYPVMLGSQRVGPDLANVGERLPDPNWHLRHLYAPRLVERKSSMPPYRFLFEKRRIEKLRSADALDLPAEFASGPEFEIVPTRESRALVAYLLSLRADTPLFEAPFTVAGLAASAPGTNAAPTTRGASTNAANSPPTNTPAK
ncbi:MAG TPA: ribosomal protein L7/L12 [Verrucomicrobiae bacterium]